MDANVQTDISELNLLPKIKLKSKRQTDPLSFKKFKFQLKSDQNCYPVVLNIHPKNESYKRPTHELPVDLLVGSKKRKRSVYEGYGPEKYNGKQFRHCWIKGNETIEEIEKMQQDALNADLDPEFFEEQSTFCEDYLQRFAQNKQLEKEIEIQKRAEQEALRLYEVSEINHLPLDVPEVAVNLLKNKSKKLEVEFEKVRDYADGCIHEMVSNAFGDDGAGPFRKQRLIIGEDMKNRRQTRPFVAPDFDGLSEASAYRIMSYYDMPDKHADLPTMKKVIANHFEAGNYHPEEEILSAIGTARLGTNSLEFKGRNHEVDELYLDNVVSNPDFSDGDKTVTRGKKKQPPVVLQNITPKKSTELMKLQQKFNLHRQQPKPVSTASASKKREKKAADVGSSASASSSNSSTKKAVQKTRILPKRANKGVKKMDLL